MHERFHIAGVELELDVVGQPSELLGFYRHYPGHGGDPQIRLRVHQEPDFCEGRERGPSYPAFETVESSPEHLVLERFDAAGTVRWHSGLVEGDFRCGPSPNSLEATIRIVCSIALPRHGTLILHSSAVADARGAHIFSGKSGAGKSTISTMLEEAYPVLKLSDELLLLRRHPGGGFAVAVSPFIGSKGLPHGSEHPAASIQFLVQAPEHQRTPKRPAGVMGELCQHVLTYARDPYTNQCVLDLVASIADSVPSYELRFAKRPDVGEVLGITC